MLPGRWEQRAAIQTLPDAPAVSSLAVHDEILPNQLSGDVSSATEWPEVPQTWPASHSKDFNSVIILEGERKLSTPNFLLKSVCCSLHSLIMTARLGVAAPREWVVTEPVLLLQDTPEAAAVWGLQVNAHAGCRVSVPSCSTLPGCSVQCSQCDCGGVPGCTWPCCDSPESLPSILACLGIQRSVPAEPGARRTAGPAGTLATARSLIPPCRPSRQQAEAAALGLCSCPPSSPAVWGVCCPAGREQLAPEHPPQAEAEHRQIVTCSPWEGGMGLMDLRAFPKGIESREHILVVKRKNTSLLSSVKITFCCLVQANCAGLTQRLLARSEPERQLAFNSAAGAA